MPYKDSEDKSLPSRIKKLAKDVRQAFVDAFNRTFKKTKSEGRSFATANYVVNKMLNASNGLFEIKGECGTVKEMKELTDDDIKSYGLDPLFCHGRPNMKVIEGDLLLANTPFTPLVTEDMKEEGITTLILPAELVASNLGQLQAMPIHISQDLSSHYKDGKYDKKTLAGEYSAIGTILAAKMVTRDGFDEPWCRILGALWEDNYPEAVAEISERREEMGMSVEMLFTLQGLEATETNAIKLTEFSFRGAAILAKDMAAFPDSQLLVANKVNGRANTGGDR